MIDFFQEGLIGLHCLSKEGIIIQANSADYKYLGYATDEYIGRPISDFHADPDVVADILTRLLRREHLHDYPARLRCKDGSIRHVEITSSMSALHSRCFTRDVTEQTITRQRLLKQQVDQQVEQQRLQTQLRQLCANVAHDLQTPLMAFTLGLADICLSLREHEILETLSATAVGMQHTITRYLEYSKVENGIPLVPTMSQTDLQGSMRTISRLFNLLTVSHTLHIKCTETATVMLDRHWFEENILAFVSNALKYTAPCPLVLDITLTETRLRMALTDEGPYIDPVTKASLFQVFTRGPTPSKTGGCGLGLYSVSTRIAALGGSCGVEDRRDTIHGSVFWFEIPIERVVARAQETKCLDVLVVDDTLITRKVVSKMLTRLGHRVSLAVNGVDALARMRAQRWDVVVMDLQMPIMGGEESTRLFRADEVHQPRMRIICSTANTEWCHDPALFDAVLFKPFTPESCMQSLHAPNPDNA